LSREDCKKGRTVNSLRRRSASSEPADDELAVTDTRNYYRLVAFDSAGKTFTRERHFSLPPV
jgi:hypothetical protein